MKQHIQTLKESLKYSMRRIEEYDHSFGMKDAESTKRANEQKKASLKPLQAALEYLNKFTT